MGNCSNIAVGIDPLNVEKMRKFNATNLTIKANTWNRDSHGLFDYESKTITKAQIKVPDSCHIIREQEEIKLLSNDQQKNNETKKLVQIDIRDNKYVIDSDLITYDPKLRPELEGLNENCVWQVVKSMKTSKGQIGYELKVGDYLKLGRIRFRIRELQGLKTEKNNSFLFADDQEILNMDEIPPQNQDEGNPLSCRICLGDSDEQDNPFITPCKCDGSVRYIHLQCLQQWLKSRLHPKTTSYSISFVWKTFDCELCKSQFPNMIRLKNVVYNTVELPKPSAPYITLEILSKDKNICKGVHVITLAQKNIIKLGRGNDSDIKISDISVSRCHAVLSFENDIFTLQDTNSKFGTLILCREPIPLDDNNNNIAVQVGRTVFTFTLKKNWKIYHVGPQSSIITNNNSKISESQIKKEENLMNKETEDKQTGIQQKQNEDNKQIQHQSSLKPLNLPEFHDPAEELEKYQREGEIQNNVISLKQQVDILNQHMAKINQSIQESKNETEKQQMLTRKQKLKEKIDQLNEKIKQFENQQNIQQQENKNNAEDNK